MIRKLLIAWLVIGTLLMAAGIAAGQVIYQRGPILPWSQRAYIGSQGVPGGCQIGPGARMICSPGACTAPGQSSWQPSRPGGPRTVQPILPPTTGRARTGAAQGGATARTPSPVVVPDRWRAVCRVMCEEGGGVRSWGSGVLTGIHQTDDLAAVLTCAHTLRDQRGAVIVYFPDGSGYQATVRAQAPEQDLALLWIKKPRNAVTPIPLAKHDPKPGDALFSMGYQGAKTWQSHIARFTKLYPAGWYGFATGGGSGFSGGPVIDADSCVAGIRWGQDASSEAMASPPSLIRRLFAPDWLFETELSRPSAASDAKPPATLPPGAADSTPAAPGSCAVAADLADLKAQMAEIREALASLAPIPGPPGKDGADGKPGPVGPPGPVAAAKPWYLRTVHPETGEEKIVEIWPGDTVTLRLFEFPRK